MKDFGEKITGKICTVGVCAYATIAVKVNDNVRHLYLSWSRQSRAFHQKHDVKNRNEEVELMLFLMERFFAFLEDSQILKIKLGKMCGLF